MKIKIINGPNLNLLGQRETEWYGHQTFEAYLEQLTFKYAEVSLTHIQSNHEGAIIDALHDSYEVEGIVLNAGAYTHTSLAIADAIRAIQTPVIEVHISNVYQREVIRHQSLLASSCLGSIIGLGLKGYDLAIEYFIKRS